ncbi:MAG: DUF58 domain-containing protein [Clostridia bacterium]|nr:DUF58 domain-containing protein [Clostridia bacterium]
MSNSKNSGEAYDETHKGQDVSEVFDMRDYQQGDSVKSIHWKLSSKLDKLIIREFGNPINYHTALYYDTEIEEGTAKEGMRDLQNGILQMTASMSRSLIQSGFTHHMISFEDLKEMEKLVEDNTSYLQVLAEMMCRKIVGTREQYLAQMDLLLQEKRFTNIIMVCGKLDMSNIHQLSRRAGLTVVYINGNNEDSVEKGENFTIISVPIGKLDKNIQMIEF